MTKCYKRETKTVKQETPMKTPNKVPNTNIDSNNIDN